MIQQDLNFITIHGKIIASTDTERIGSYHEAAVLVVQKKQTVITEFDGQYKGTRKGINLLLQYENEIIGVIGITGEVKEVAKYGEIIQKMAEILIVENYSQAVYISSRERDRYIIEEIFKYSENSPRSANHYFNPFKTARLLRTMIVKVKTEKQSFLYLFENLLREKFSKSDTFHFLKNENRYYILTSLVNKQTLAKIITELRNELMSFASDPLRVGIGKTGTTIKELQSSFIESEKSLLWNNAFTQKSYSFYEELDLGAVLTYIPEDVQTSYSSKILERIPAPEFQKLKQIIYSYGKNNRSISACADQLHMHKNTFQYQLDKVQRYTGFDPRDMEDFMLLKLAFIFSDLVSVSVEETS